MIDIQKTKEPSRLIEYRKSTGADWDGPATEKYTFSDLKDELRTALLKEQHHLCAYCMRRLQNFANKVRIEHIYPRSLCGQGSNMEYLKLDYNNLVACCQGKIGGENCCDAKKANTPLSFTPVSPHGLESRLSYSKNGEISGDCQNLTKELNDTLGLNAPLFLSNRKSVYDGYINFLKKIKVTPSKIDRHINELSDTNNLEWGEYVGVTLFWLKKKQNSLKKQTL